MPDWEHIYDEDELLLTEHPEVVDSLGTLIWEGRNSKHGWLTPDGTFIGTGYAAHDLYARRVLVNTSTELESRGWVKVSPGRPGGVNLTPGAELTDAQADWLLSRQK